MGASSSPAQTIPPTTTENQTAPDSQAAGSIASPSPSAGGLTHSTDRIRVATFNVSLFGRHPGDVAERLQGGADEDAIDIAAVIRTVRPDVILVNELDHDPAHSAAEIFVRQYLPSAGRPKSGPAIDYPHRWSPPSNTGQPSGLDLDHDGKFGEPEDAWGFGRYPGQYAFTVLSRLPIDRKSSRSFAKFRWRDLPGAVCPADPETGKPYYSDTVWNALRLSSKNHVDVALRWGDQTLHLFACHPTPPVFDGPEDRNGCRNHDEIKFWTKYLDNSAAIVDDQGGVGGLDGWTAGQTGDPFVLLGDLNSDPLSGDSRQGAIRGLLADRRIQPVVPERRGAQGVDRRSTTAQFGRGEMRVDYVLPSANVRVIGSGVFWPSSGELGHDWIQASDHRLVWVDIEPMGRP